jgi:hypothetical protein
MVPFADPLPRAAFRFLKSVALVASLVLLFHASEKNPLVWATHLIALILQIAFSFAPTRPAEPIFDGLLRKAAALLILAGLAVPLVVGGWADLRPAALALALAAATLLAPVPRLSDRVKGVRDRVLARSGISPAISEALPRLSVLAVDLDGLCASAPFAEVATVSGGTVFSYVYENGTFSVDGIDVDFAECLGLSALLRPGDCVFGDGPELPEKYIDDRTGSEVPISPRIAEILAWQRAEWSAQFRVETVRGRSGALLALAAYPRSLGSDDYCTIAEIAQLGIKVVLSSQAADVQRTSAEALKNYGDVLTGPDWIQIWTQRGGKVAGFEKVDDVVNFQKGTGLIGVFSTQERAFSYAALRFSPEKGEIRALSGIRDALAVSLKARRRYRRIADYTLALGAVFVAGAIAGTFAGVAPLTIASCVLAADSCSAVLAWRSVVAIE